MLQVFKNYNNYNKRVIISLAVVFINFVAVNNFN